MATIFRDNVDSPAIIIGGVDDHVHALVNLSRKFRIMDIIQESKTETTKWLKKQSSSLAKMQWQGGYGVFGVSESNSGQVKRYIANQVEHHKKISYQDEFRKLCKRHGVELDERYAWD